MSIKHIELYHYINIISLHFIKNHLHTLQLKLGEPKTNKLTSNLHPRLITVGVVHLYQFFKAFIFDNLLICYLNKKRAGPQFLPPFLLSVQWVIYLSDGFTYLHPSSLSRASIFFVERIVSDK